MMMLRLTVIFLCSGLFVIQAAEPMSQMIIGTNPNLSDGATALRFGDYEEGLRLTLDGLSSVLTLRDRARALSNLCAGYLGLGQFVEALEACDKALELSDRNWRTYNNRALALLGTGRLVAARVDVDKGQVLNPDSSLLGKTASLIEAREQRQLIAGNVDSETY